MVTTRSAERRAALQSQELALRTRTVEASPSVSASKRKSSGNAPRNSDRSQLQLDINSGGTTDTIVQTGPSAPAAEETDEDQTDRGNIDGDRNVVSLNKVKRFASEELEEEELQIDAVPIAEENFHADSLLDGVVSDDGDGAPEVVSSRLRTPKRKVTSNRGSGSRKKTKFAAPNDNEIAIANEARASGNTVENTSTPPPATERNEQATIKLAAPNTKHGLKESETDKPPVTRPRYTTPPDLDPSSDDERSFHSVPATHSPSELKSTNTLKPPAQSSTEKPSYTNQVRSLSQQQSFDPTSSPPTSRQTFSKPDQSKPLNLPPKTSSSKSKFHKQLMHNRQKNAKPFGRGFKLSNHWSGKKRHFASAASVR